MTHIASSETSDSEDVLITDQIVLLDTNLLPTGSADKLISHHANTPLHLAFSIYLFNKNGELLVTRRAASKKVWPGVWTNSCCGHPMPEESLEQAVLRRCDYELGITKLEKIKMIIPDYIYKTPPFNGIIEHEFCPIFAGLIDGTIKLNQNEVSEFTWMSWEEFVANAQRDTNNSWSWWCKDQLRLLKDNKHIERYIKP